MSSLNYRLLDSAATSLMSSPLRIFFRDVRYGSCFSSRNFPQNLDLVGVSVLVDECLSQACLQIGWAWIGDHGDCFPCGAGFDGWSDCLPHRHCFHRSHRLDFVTWPYFTLSSQYLYHPINFRVFLRTHLCLFKIIFSNLSLSSRCFMEGDDIFKRCLFFSWYQVFVIWMGNVPRVSIPDRLRCLDLVQQTCDCKSSFVLSDALDDALVTFFFIFLDNTFTSRTSVCAW